MLIDFCPGEGDFYEGDNVKPLLKYLLFAGAVYGQGEGVKDLVATADTIEELKETRHVRDAGEYDWWQISEHTTLRVVEESD